MTRHIDRTSRLTVISMLVAVVIFLVLWRVGAVLDSCGT